MKCINLPYHPWSLISWIKYFKKAKFTIKISSFLLPHVVKPKRMSMMSKKPSTKTKLLKKNINDCSIAKSCTCFHATCSLEKGSKGNIFPIYTPPSPIFCQNNLIHLIIYLWN